MKVDVIIPTMHKPSLVRVHRHLKGIDCISTIVIADFSPSVILLSEAESGKMQPVTKHLNIQGHQHFNKSIAINVGFHFTSAPLIAICDADILLEPAFFSEAINLLQEKPTKRYAVTPKFIKESADGGLRTAPGICLMSKNIFNEIEGYCNAFKGWGLEDRDFLRRLESLEVKIKEISWGLHLSHDDDERTRNYHCANISLMRQNNWNLFCKRRDEEQRYGTLRDDIISNKFYELY